MSWRITKLHSDLCPEKGQGLGKTTTASEHQENSLQAVLRDFKKSPTVFLTVYIVDFCSFHWRLLSMIRSRQAPVLHGLRLSWPLPPPLASPPPPPTVSQSRSSVSLYHNILHFFFMASSTFYNYIFVVQIFISISSWVPGFPPLASAPCTSKCKYV